MGNQASREDRADQAAAATGTSAAKAPSEARSFNDSDAFVNKELPPTPNSAADHAASPTAEAFGVLEVHNARPVSLLWSIICPVASFVGRRAELAQLAELLRPAPAREPATRIVITGMGGTGKSTLARFAVQQHHARFSGGWVVDGSTEATFLADLASLASGLALGDVEPEQLASAVANKLSEPSLRGWVLLVDNVDDSEFKPQLLKLLPSVGGCVVVTSRLARWAADWTVLPLSVLAHADAIRLLSDTAREEEISALEEVATELSDLPLALVNAREYVECTGITWPSYLNKLKTQLTQLLSKNVAEFEAVLPSLQLTLKAALEEDGNVELLFHLLQMLHSNNIPRSLLAACYATVNANADVDKLLGLLSDYSIIQLSAITIAVHPLIQTALRGIAPCPLKVQELLVSVIGTQIEQHKKDDHARMSQLRVHLETLVPLLAQLAPDTLTLATAWHALGEVLFDTYADTTAAHAAFQKALLIRQMVLGERHLVVATTLGLLGATSLDAMEQRDLGERALAIEVDLLGRDHTRVASTLSNLGQVYAALGDYAKQKTLLEEALLIFEREYGPDHPQVAILLGNLGNAYGNLGDFARQKDLLERALAINERHYGPDGPHWPYLASTLASLGNAYGALGDTAQAKALLERALAIQERYYGPDHRNLAITLKSLSDAYSSLGDGTKSKRLLERALTIEEQHRGPS